jgi:hypothetical protein
MVITTPMTASAAGLADAYDTGTGSDEDKSSNTDTNTDTNTNTGGIKPGEIPPVVEEFNINIFGIALDKETLDFDLGDEEQSNTLQARVLFDGYDPSNEDMQWAVSAEEKAKIEKNIHWYSSNPDVAEVRIIDENDNTKAMVIAKGDGKAEITAWIEADKQVYSDEPNRPTPGDYQATAIVTVTEHATGVSFNYGDTPFVAKRQYDLNDYTYLTFKNGRELPVKACQESVTFSNMKINNKTTKATLKDGILKITKSLEGDIITFNMVTEGGLKAEGKITIAKENPVTKLTFTNNKMAIDMGTDEAVDGVVSKESNTLTVEKKDANAVTTDLFTWTESSKGKVINVTGNGDKATITAVSVGSSTVTVKASSGKSAKLKVTVTATPSDVKIEAPDMSESGYVTYTGKPTTMTAVLYGKNGIKIPQGKTKLAWTVNDKSYAKVSSKGIVTPANILYAKNSKGKLDKKNLVEGLSVTSKVSVSVKGTSINDDYDLKIDQSNVESFGIDKYNLADTSKISKVSLVKNKATLKDDIFVGQSYNFVALATGKDPEGNIVDFSNATAWTVSGKGINSKVNEATLQTTITSKVKATVKASYITISKNARSGAYSAKKNTATITISPIQMANTLTLNKNAVVVNPKKGNNRVTLNVKALAPKGATDKIMWKVMSRDAVTGTAIKGLSASGADLENKHNSPRNDAKNKKLTVIIPGTAPVGSVIKVGAYAEGGAVAYAYIYVTDKTTKVVTGLESVKPKNTISLKAGETAQLTPKLVTANGEKAVGESKWSQGNTIAYDTEPVSYILDKKSAQYVKVDANGKIVALQKGTAKVTIKTISGKSAKVTIKIAE